MRKVGILIFPDVEILDFCGPFEVFSVAGRIAAPGSFEVFTIAEGIGPVRTHNGLSVNPHYRLDDCPPPELLLIPGGLGTRPLINNASLLEWIRTRAAQAELTLSVCTGSLLLAKAGLLEGRAATTHAAAMNLLRELAPNTTLHPGERYVDNGAIITSAGIAAGIDMSLHVVERLHGAEVASKTAAYMEYPWQSGS